MTRGLRGLLAGLLVGFAVLAPAGAASAHDALSKSSPKDDAEVAQAPAEVTLTYTASVLKLGSVVRVIGPDGEDVVDGTPSFTDNEVTQALQPDLPAGKYRIDWQVTSSDGHPIAGKLAFTVTEGAAPATTAAPSTDPAGTAPAAPTTAPPTTVSPVTDTSADEGSSWATPAAFALIAVVIVAAVVGAAVLARRRSNS